jgi:hypothetical protein
MGVDCNSQKVCASLFLAPEQPPVGALLQPVGEVDKTGPMDLRLSLDQVDGVRPGAEQITVGPNRPVPRRLLFLGSIN